MNLTYPMTDQESVIMGLFEVQYRVIFNSLQVLLESLNTPLNVDTIKANICSLSTLKLF